MIRANFQLLGRITRAVHRLFLTIADERAEILERVRVLLPGLDLLLVLAHGPRLSLLETVLDFVPLGQRALQLLVLLGVALIGESPSAS